MADVKKIIKDLQGNLAGSNDDQMKAVQLLKGLATSDEPISNEFMKKLDKETTRISKEVLKQEESIEEISVPNKHKLKIAKDTMKMSDAGAMIMGGMTKAEAREILRKAGYSDRQIASMEESSQKENIIEVKEDVVIIQEDGTKVILEKGDKIQLIEADAQDISLAKGKTVINVDDKTRNWGYADITFDDYSVLRVYEGNWFII